MPRRTIARPAPADAPPRARARREHADASAAAPERTNLPIHHMPGHYVRRLQQVHVSLFADEVKDLDLTTVQFAALTAVSIRPDIDQATLSALIGYDRATMGGVVDRLEAKGWIKRSSDASDRRVKRLSVTPAGHKVLRDVGPAVRKVQERLVEALTPDEQRAFEALCRKILAHHVG